MKVLPRSPMRRASYWIAAMALVAVARAGYPGPLEEWENHQMARLWAIQADPQSRLAWFTTDGCSGGMSGAWQRFADLMPGFRARYGDRPPWESCCVEHDRSYWWGATVDGYFQRRLADERLRRCVSQVGRARREELSDRLGVWPDHVENAFDAVAEMMYVAVRAGGGPCTGLSWRWGYGWPPCKWTP